MIIIFPFYHHIPRNIVEFKAENSRNLLLAKLEKQEPDLPGSVLHCYEMMSSFSAQTLNFASKLGTG